MSTHRYGAVAASPRLCHICGKPTRDHVYPCRDTPTSWKRKSTDIFACEVCDLGFASSAIQEKHLKSREHIDTAREKKWKYIPSSFGRDVAYYESRGAAYDAPYRMRVKAERKAARHHLRESRRGLHGLGLTKREAALLLHTAAEESPVAAYVRTIAEGDEPGACPECFGFHAWEDCPRNPDND